VVVSGELEILINYTTHPLILNYHFTLVYHVLYYVDLNLCVWTSFCFLVQWYQFSYVLQKKYLFYLNIILTLEENMFHLPVFFQLQFFERYIGCSKFHWVVVLHIVANWKASPQGFQFLSGDGGMVGFGNIGMSVSLKGPHLMLMLSFKKLGVWQNCGVSLGLKVLDIFVRSVVFRLLVEVYCLPD
jgi:hypothetical protein